MFGTRSGIRDILQKNPNSQDFWEFWRSVYQALISTHEREPGYEAMIEASPSIISSVGLSMIAQSTEKLSTNL